MSFLEKVMNEERLRRLKEEVLSHGLDGIALMPGPNMLYLSGIHAHVSERPLLLFFPADDDPAVIIPDLEAGKARAVGIDEERIFSWNDDQGYMGAFQQACAHLELSDYLLGVEALHMRVLELELLRRYAPGLATAHAEPIMDTLRIVKDEDEIGAMRRAVAAAESAMEALIPQIKIGQTEKQIAAILSQELTSAGSQANPFGPIVSAGPNGALPHAIPTNRAIREGDLLVIDWGAIVDDYPADITRTFAVGALNRELTRVYNTVKEANQTARSAARPGITGNALDLTAREVIEQAGYGPYFIHRTGHGLGLEIHEHPYISSANRDPMPVGAVFTIEPGIYLPDKGGVRIEDNVVLTEAGAESLTTLSRELIQVG